MTLQREITHLSSNGGANSVIPEGWPPCAAVYLARTGRTRRYLVIAACIVAVISLTLYLVGRALVDHPNRLGDLFQVLGVAGGGTLILLLAWGWLSSWLFARKERQQLQTLFEGDFLVHWTMKKSDYATAYNFSDDMPERLEAYIGRDMAYFVAGSIRWHPRPNYLVNANVVDIPSGKFIFIKMMMRFVFSSLPPANYTFLIPVPAGQEEKAKEVVEILRANISN